MESAFAFAVVFFGILIVAIIVNTIEYYRIKKGAVK